MNEVVWNLLEATKELTSPIITSVQETFVIVILLLTQVHSPTEVPNIIAKTSLERALDQGGLSFLKLLCLNKGAPPHERALGLMGLRILFQDTRMQDVETEAVLCVSSSSQVLQTQSLAYLCIWWKSILKKIKVFIFSLIVINI